MQKTDQNTPPQNKETLRFEWEQAYGHPLTDDEFRQIQDNLVAFFDLLHSWQIRNESPDRAGDDLDCDPELGGRPE